MRFRLCEDSNGWFSIFDNEDVEDEPLLFLSRHYEMIGVKEVTDLLNEQSINIQGLLLDRSRQEEKLDIARRNMSKQLEKIEELEKENEQLRQELEENKSIINFCSNGEDEDLHRLIKENEQLRQQLQEKQEDERLYAQEIVKLNKEAKEVLNFKTLGSDY